MVFIENTALRIASAGVIGALSLIFISEGARAILSSHANGVPITQLAQAAPNITGNCNAVGSNNSLCNNYGPQRLTFSAALGDELLARMPIKKKVVIRSVGGEADQIVATDIQTFLHQNGYDVSRTMIGMLVPPPDHKISLGENPDAYILTIAPGAY
jgi:hypothetical protein